MPNQAEASEPHPDASQLAPARDGSTSSVSYAPDPSASLTPSPAHAAIIKSICALYSGSASESDMQVYAHISVYDDPFSYCRTRREIAGQWWGIPVLFSTSRTVATQVVKDTEEEVAFKLRQEWGIKGVPGTKEVDCLVTLKLDNEGKVVYHKDMWNADDYKHNGLGQIFKKLNGEKLVYVTKPPEDL